MTQEQDRANEALNEALERIDLMLQVLPPGPWEIKAHGDVLAGDGRRILNTNYKHTTGFDDVDSFVRYGVLYMSLLLDLIRARDVDKDKAFALGFAKGVAFGKGYDETFI